jgi:hypothetical protein
MNTKQRTPAELALKPAGEDQVNRARELCSGNETLENRLLTFLEHQPNRGQMVNFMEELRQAAASIKLDLTVAGICQSLGIENPTSTEKLLALQIGLLQEQTSALQLAFRRLSNQANATLEENKSNGVITTLVGAAIFGAVIAN